MVVLLQCKSAKPWKPEEIPEAPPSNLKASWTLNEHGQKSLSIESRGYQEQTSQIV